MAILEHALLHVRPGEELAFEEAIARATPLIAASPGFRGSDRYDACRALLHHFYDPMPTMTYFGEIL